MLTTERCYLVPFQRKHITDVEPLFLDARVRAFLGGVRPHADVRNNLLQALDDRDGHLYWSVFHAQTGDCIGFVSMEPHHDGIDQEISYQLSPSVWGNGYGTEIVHELIRFALIDMQLKKVVAETQTANKASCKTLEKVGMHVERIVTRFGNEQAIYAILNHMK